MFFKANVKWAGRFTYVDRSTITYQFIYTSPGFDCGLGGGASSVGSEDGFKGLVGIKCHINAGSFLYEAADVMTNLALIWYADSDGGRFRFGRAFVLLLKGCGYGAFYQLFRVSVEVYKCCSEVIYFG